MATKRATLSDSAGITARRTATTGAPALGIVGALATESTPSDTTARLDQLAPNPDNPRTDMGDLTELANSIGASGLVQPLIVTTADAWIAEHPGRGDELHGCPWVVIAGHRRLAAAHHAKVAELPITVRDMLAAGTARSALIENIHRADLPPLDEAAALAALLDAGLSQRELARQTGISQPKISKRVSLLSLPAAAKTDLTAGALTVSDALRLLELPADARDTVYRQVGTRGVSSSLSYLIDITKGRIAREQKEAELRRQLTAEGITLIDDAYDTFNNYWDHQLRSPDDITHAKDAGLCVATVADGNIAYWCTEPRPWPWMPAPSDDTDTDTDTSDQRPPTETRAPDIYAIAAKVRHDLVTTYLHPDNADAAATAGVLTELTLLGANEADEEPALVYQLAGDDPQQGGWDAYADWLHEQRRANVTRRRLVALAVAFARAEAAVPDADYSWNNEITDTGHDYLDLLENQLGYQRADHEHRTSPNSE